MSLCLSFNRTTRRKDNVWLCSERLAEVVVFLLSCNWSSSSPLHYHSVTSVAESSVLCSVHNLNANPDENPFIAYMFSSQILSSFSVLSYQPSTVRVPNVQALDAPYLTSTLADYAVPFHHSTLATIPTDMQSESAG